MFFDEARFGTHTKRAYGWFVKGSRPRIDVKIGYKNFYLYGAVNSATGENFSLLMPNVNTASMNLYLSELSKEFIDQRIALIMDQAGWHKSKTLVVPDNIQLIYLPPYSPELNPIERLWLYIKKNVLNNRLYEQIELLEDNLCNFIKSLQKTTVQSICSAQYLDS
jgi:transposase